MNTDDLAAQVRHLGRVGAEILKSSEELYAPHQMQEPYAGISMERDIEYGPDERHRLDIFRSGTGGQRPILVFVHGGGFVRGEKKEPGKPYFDNVGLWGARHDLIGVNINYRLAPGHSWPCGAEDVGAAVRWLRRSGSSYGGDPARIYLLGHSAGAAHVASYIALPELHEGVVPSIAGAILVSGLYDLEISPPNKAYFGDDAALYKERSSVQGLARTDIPLMAVLAELDPPAIEKHAISLLHARLENNRELPRFVRLMGHNHFTTMLHLNSPDEELGRALLEFIRLGH